MNFSESYRKQLKESNYDSTDYSNLKLSKSEVIDLLNKSLLNIPSKIYDSTKGKFILHGVLSDKYLSRGRDTLFIWLFGSKTPGTFTYGITPSIETKFTDFVTNKLIQQLDATQIDSRRDPNAYNFRSSRYMKDIDCYKAPLENLIKLPEIVEQIYNSELK